MINNNNERYETRDLYEAAYLFTVGFTLNSTYKIREDLIFVFDDKNNCLDFLKEYWSYGGSITPRKYGDVLRSFKGLIHESK